MSQQLSFKRVIRLFFELCGCFILFAILFFLIVGLFGRRRTDPPFRGRAPQAIGLWCVDRSLVELVFDLRLHSSRRLLAPRPAADAMDAGSSPTDLAPQIRTPEGAKVAIGG